ncbi:MAG TPA: sigma-70 family RNA polymerase sigma factor [Actinomycetes bacterium]|nr:sigma-70 family RNA polymerase sigma factor [Actinomycetes bacterium]
MEVDRELVEAAQAGDRWALEELVRRTHRSVYTCALRLVGNPDDAADVTQDVYLRVVRKLSSFRHEASFTTWLNRVTTNVAMSALKRRTRRIAVEGGVVPPDTRDPSPDPAERAETVALARRLECLVAELPEGQRQVLVLRDLYGQSTDEVADAMGLTPGAVKVRLFRARERLKAELESAEGGQVVVLNGRRRASGRRS